MVKKKKIKKVATSLSVLASPNTPPPIHFHSHSHSHTLLFFPSPSSPSSSHSQASQIFNGPCFSCFFSFFRSSFCSLFGREAGEKSGRLFFSAQALLSSYPKWAGQIRRLRPGEGGACLHHICLTQPLNRGELNSALVEYSRLTASLDPDSNFALA